MFRALRASLTALSMKNIRGPGQEMREGFEARAQKTHAITHAITSAITRLSRDNPRDNPPR